MQPRRQCEPHVCVDFVRRSNATTQFDDQNPTKLFHDEMSLLMRNRFHEGFRLDAHKRRKSEGSGTVSDRPKKRRTLKNRSKPAPMTSKTSITPGIDRGAETTRGDALEHVGEARSKRGPPSVSTLSKKGAFARGDTESSKSASSPAEAESCTKSSVTAAATTAEVTSNGTFEDTTITSKASGGTNIPRPTSTNGDTSSVTTKSLPSTKKSSRKFSGSREKRGSRKSSKGRKSTQRSSEPVDAFGGAIGEEHAQPGAEETDEHVDQESSKGRKPGPCYETRSQLTSRYYPTSKFEEKTEKSYCERKIAWKMCKIALILESIILRKTTIRHILRHWKNGARFCSLAQPADSM